MPKRLFFSSHQIRISECFCEAPVRLWCVNELKNGLQQCSVIPAEPNLGKGWRGGCCGGWGWQVEGEGGGGVSVCVCAQELQNKPINIPGSLASCSSELNLTAHSMHTTENTHGVHTQTPTWGHQCFFCLFSFLCRCPWITSTFMSLFLSQILKYYF